MSSRNRHLTCGPGSARARDSWRPSRECAASCRAREKRYRALALVTVSSVRTLEEWRRGVRMKVILFGATGMVGQGVLRECLSDDGVEGVLAVGRSSTGQAHPKLRELIHKDLFDFGADGA